VSAVAPDPADAILALDELAASSIVLAAMLRQVRTGEIPLESSEVWLAMMPYAVSLAPASQRFLDWVRVAEQAVRQRTAGQN
jgi:hypothetical protein